MQLFVCNSIFGCGDEEQVRLGPFDMICRRLIRRVERNFDEKEEIGRQTKEKRRDQVEAFCNYKIYA
jgi:hypothetical protein